MMNVDDMLNISKLNEKLVVDGWVICKNLPFDRRIIAGNNNFDIQKVKDINLLFSFHSLFYKFPNTLKKISKYIIYS